MPITITAIIAGLAAIVAAYAMSFAASSRQRDDAMTIIILQGQLLDAEDALRICYIRHGQTTDYRWKTRRNPPNVGSSVMPPSKAYTRPLPPPLTPSGFW